jgi:microcystin-dependent protein
MPVSSWSTTAASNGATLGIDIAENCDAANVNNAIREMMAQLKTKLDAIDTSIAAIETPDATVAVKTGTIIAFGASSAPSDYLECNGNAVSRSTYATLFGVIGTSFGTGDGSTTFNLPDLRGEFVRGWDHGKGTDSGRAFASAQSDELEAHTHTVAQGPGGGTAGGPMIESGTSSQTHSTTSSSTGGTETRPRNIALLYAIKT